MRDLNITEKLFRYRDEADILFGCSALTLASHLSLFPLLVEPFSFPYFVAAFITLIRILA